MLKYIYILPLGEVSLDFLGKLKKDLENKFGFKIEIRNRVEMPDYVNNKEKDQYNSRIILNELTKLSFKNTEKILAITDLDLFTEDLSYIFGQAETSGKICLISSKRLNPKFYNKNFDKDLFYSRILKEAIHELGHTFGLKHCKNKKCVMHFSNNIEETDFKKSEFCEECGRVYQYVVL